MRKLMNTLYLVSDNVYLSLENQNVVVHNPNSEIGRFPLHTLESIVSFSRKGISIPLISACSKRGIPIFLLSIGGSLIAEISMPSQGNILLRKAQYLATEDPEISVGIAAAFVSGKLNNQKHMLDRFQWDHQPDSFLKKASISIGEILKEAETSQDKKALRGLEGEASSIYFSCFDRMIQDESGDFKFNGRTRRPPLDRVNAMLSFGYILLTNECTAALESVGLDASAGFLHEDHPGRKSLACDLVEEFRVSVVDRFVLSLIHRQIIQKDHFEENDGNGVFLNDEGRKVFLHHWQINKKKETAHPFLTENVMIGLLPYAQALLLARVIREELPEYPPYIRR